MISCTEFIAAYSELFKFLEKKGGGTGFKARRKTGNKPRNKPRNKGKWQARWHPGIDFLPCRPLFNWQPTHK